jgi:hypothetical protein
MGIKANVRSRGLGDSIAKITKATGIEKAVKTVAKAVTGSEECGCSKRQDTLNRVFPYNNK